MKRQILFRGQRKDTGGWVIGSLHIDHTGDSFISFCKTELVEGSDYGLPVPYSHAVIPDTIGQYTAFLDCNRRDIFEGDIVRDEINHIVRFGEYEQDGFDHTGFYLESIDCGLKGSVSKEDAQYLTVIGNIYQNPELLPVPNQPGN